MAEKVVKKGSNKLMVVLNVRKGSDKLTAVVK